MMPTRRLNVDEALDRYAVMGNPVAHSLSPVIHQLFAVQTNRVLSYEKIQIDFSCFEQQVQNFFETGGLGLNITLPCKQRAFAMSDELSARCLQAQAANTLWRRSGKLFADNTDGIGLIRDLKRYVDIVDKKILLLGAGGAARGIIGPLLAARPAKLTLANRTIENAQSLHKNFPSITHVCRFTELNDVYDVIINATSAGLDNQPIVLPTAMTVGKPFCYDLVYRQTSDTAFVAWARALGCDAVDGLGMLVEQAAEAFYIWHGVMPQTLPVIKKCSAR